MKVKSILKACGCSIININEENVNYDLVAIIDYSKNAINRQDEKIYDCAFSLPDEIKNRNVDFFTSSIVEDSNNKLVEGIKIYLK